MESEDDIQPLIDNERGESRDLYLGLTTQIINVEPEYEQVVYGYRKSTWRTILIYFLSVLTCGIPFLVFHWVPKWFLYSTCIKCCFQVADRVLVVETYQKKCKSYYIHRILEKNIDDKSGLLNEAFQDESYTEREPSESPDSMQTPLHFDDGTTLNVTQYRYFMHKKQTLVWEWARARWARLAGLEAGAGCAALRRRAARAPPPALRTRMFNIYGPNEIKVPVQSIGTLVLLEVFNPFYVFQLFTIAVWLAEPYYYYCIAVVLMSTFGVATSVIQTKKNQNSLRATVEAYDSVSLWRGGEVDSRAVCPGDVVELPPAGCLMHFDAVLISGSAVVNESMLTGESVPVSKTALLPVERAFSLKEHSCSVLFCGTHVIQAQRYDHEPVKALVLRTGYNTSKGQLVRSILYPVPADFKFDRDSYKFIFILAIIAVCGLAYTVALKAYRALTPGDIALKALDIITIVIPPALPAAMTVGRLYAVSRLQKARVACLNTRAVNVSGSIDCVAFDKTGTLTEDGLDMWGVVPVVAGASPPALGAPLRTPRTLNDLHPLKLAMASCHSLSVIDGQLAGDPLDLKMFECTGWSLEKPAVSDPTRYGLAPPAVVRPRGHAGVNVDDLHLPLELGVVVSHQFVSSLQRAAVATQLLGENVVRAFCKGAPEMIAKLCIPDTVPSNLEEVLNSYAEKGYRVIAAGAKVMEVTLSEVQTMTRDEIECELEFLGLVILENKLKPTTTGVIRELKEANIYVVMITGDNILTAVSVAKECGILEPDERIVTLTSDGGRVYCESSLRGVSMGNRTLLPHSPPEGCLALTDEESGRPAVNYKIVMTGDTWKVLRSQYPRMVARVAARGAVFARMSSDQKQQLVVEYQALGYYVAMCGDGANDCGALRAAHTGLSLSELESSVAAPFTARALPALPRVLTEGRAALATSFGVFKFMIAYSLTEFFSVAFLYYFDSNLTDFQFLFIDVALIVNFAFFFGMTEAYTGKLCKIPPLTSLLGLVPLTSLVGQMVLIGVAQYLSYYAVSSFPWYVRHTYEGDEANECWENYAIYAVSMFQYITLAVVFSHGSPYRRSVITNRQLMASVIVMTCVCVYIAVAPAEWLSNFLQLKMPKDILMGYIVLALASFNFLIALFFERVIIQCLMENKQMVPKCLKERHARKTPHLMIKRQLTDNDYLDCDPICSFDKETIQNSSSSKVR